MAPFSLVPTAQTRSVMLEMIRQAAGQRSSLIRAHEAASLSFALTSDVKAIEQCYAVITPILAKIISSQDEAWKPLASTTDWRLRAIQAWARILVKFRAFQRDDVRLQPTSCIAMWKCYVRVLRESHNLHQSFDRETVLPAIRELVLPFTRSIPQWEGSSFRSISRGAFNLFIQGLSEFANESSGWSSIAADVAFNILLPVRDGKQSQGADLESKVASIIFKLSRSPAGTHSMIDGRLIYVSVEDVLSAVRESPVNFLLPRPDSLGDQPTSLWAMVFRLLADSTQERFLAELAAALASELAVLAAPIFPNIDIPGLAFQLLGEDCGLTFILSHRAKPNTAFTIARHAPSFEPN